MIAVMALAMITGSVNASSQEEARYQRWAEAHPAEAQAHQRELDAAIHGQDWSQVKSVEQPISAEDVAEEAGYLNEIAQLLCKHNDACAKLGPEACTRQASMLITRGKTLAAHESDDTRLDHDQYWNAAKVWAKLGFPTSAILDLMGVYADIMTASDFHNHPEDRDLIGAWEGPGMDKELPILIGDAILGEQDAAQRLHVTGLQNLQPQARCARLIEVLGKRFKARAEREREKLSQ